MVSDQEIARGVETLLRQSDPNAITTLNGVVQHLEAKLGLNLSHKAGFIRDQINLLLRPPQTQTQLPPKDLFTLQHHPQFPSHQHQQFPPHFALQHHPQFPSHDLNFRQHPQQPPATLTAQPPPQLQPQSHHQQRQHQHQHQLLSQQPQPAVTKTEVFSHNAANVATTEVHKERFAVFFFFGFFLFFFLLESLPFLFLDFLRLLCVKMRFILGFCKYEFRGLAFTSERFGLFSTFCALKLGFSCPRV